jgi:antitoxin component of MazEF toxin-antitoxin module
MMELVAKTKRWGNSVGILLPKKMGIKADEDVRVHIEPVHRVLRVKDIFGKHRFKRPIKELLKEIDRDLDIEA